ncbi:MAG: hypothetical protein FJZ63_03090 [Chlamydiae bacterium]|nr:hypothetical protein [Chlamydiota bacterium]
MEKTPTRLKDYWPLIALLVVIALQAICLAYGERRYVYQAMHFFMGLFFCLFAMFKFFDLRGFVEGFRLYDVVTQKVSFYGYLYPFLELALGLSYLAFFHPLWTYSLTVLLMGISAFGVIQALKQGLDTRCACLGTVLKVPLSSVTLIEDLGMGVMACIMFFLFFR